MKQRQTTPRPGFTLVELMVVVAIIAVLAGLVSAAVVQAFKKADEMRIRNDITQLQVAITNAQTTFKVPYLPSRLRIHEDGNYNLADAVDKETLQTLSSIWPRVSWTTATDLNGNTNTTDVFDLFGEHCLAFWLGGPDGLTGFSASPTVNVTFPAGPFTLGGSRVGPFFEFKSARMGGTAGPTFVHAYADTFNQRPYLYFSSRGNNDYRVADSDIVEPVGPYTAGLGPYPVVPYPGINPRSFQIISAGPNKVFGPGGSWSSTNPIVGSPLYGTNLSGYDDLANFHPLWLGRPAN